MGEFRSGMTQLQRRNGDNAGIKSIDSHLLDNSVCNRFGQWIFTLRLYPFKQIR